MKKLSTTLLCMLILGTVPSVSHAEVSVHGTVRDISGMPIEDAQVTVMSEYFVRHITTTDSDGGYTITLPDSPVAVHEQPIEAFSLMQNFPNPFNPGTVIPYVLENPSQVELTIYSIIGQKVRTLVSEHQSPGEHRVYWNGDDAHGYGVAAGVYLYTLSAGGSFQARKMLLLDGYSGSGTSDTAPVMKTARPSRVHVENQPYTIMVKAPGYLIFDDTIQVGSSDTQCDVSLEVTEDAGTYDIPDPNVKWIHSEVRSYPGGFGTGLLSLTPSGDFQGTVALSVEANPKYHASLTSYVLDASHRTFECMVYPDADIFLPDNMDAIRDSLRVFSHHAGVTDTLQVRVDITRSYWNKGFGGTIEAFLEWLASNYVQYSMFDDMGWLGYDKYPGYTGGNWAFINESFECVSMWGDGLKYYYFGIRRREESSYFFTARKSYNTEYEEIPPEDFLSE